MSKSTSQSVLHPVIGRYLQLQRALGKGFQREQRILESLDQWLAETGSAELDPGSFAGWCQARAHLASGVRRNPMRIVRNFCLYRRRAEPTCFVPEARLFPANHQPVRPYIFTESEIARLLQAADRLTPAPQAPLRPQVYRLAIVLLYTTGLRRGELLRLRVGDHDREQQTLLVRQSKFHKSRYLPLSLDTARAISDHLRARRQRHLPVSPETPLIRSHYQNGRPYSGGGLGQGLRSLFRYAEIHTEAGRLPRIHDLRHTFAVHALLRWYRDNADIHAKLPLLATYMGHVSIVSTEHYLHFIDEVAAAASDRFAARFGALVTALPASPGGGR